MRFLWIIATGELNGAQIAFKMWNWTIISTFYVASVYLIFSVGVWAELCNAAGHKSVMLPSQTASSIPQVKHWSTSRRKRAADYTHVPRYAPANQSPARPPICAEDLGWGRGEASTGVISVWNSSQKGSAQSNQIKSNTYTSFHSSI